MNAPDAVSWSQAAALASYEVADRLYQALRPRSKPSAEAVGTLACLLADGRLFHLEPARELFARPRWCT